MISINTENLNNKWFESKRKGYFEVTGSLLGKFSNGSELVLKFFLKKSNEILKINILDKISATFMKTLEELFFQMVILLKVN